VRYLFSGAGAGTHRDLLLSGLARTLLDAVGVCRPALVAAVVVALAFVLSAALEPALLPMAVVLRSVPLVALTPLLTLVFGRGLMGTTVISGSGVFFPALVTMTFGLRSTSARRSTCARLRRRPWTGGAQGDAALVGAGAVRQRLGWAWPGR